MGLKWKLTLYLTIFIPRFNDNGANEYLIDVTHGAVDFLAAVNTALLPELNLWYHALNCGFRTVVAGETDFPCLFERVGAGRTYVHCPTPIQGDEGYRNLAGRVKVCASRMYRTVKAISWILRLSRSRSGRVT